MSSAKKLTLDQTPAIIVTSQWFFDVGLFFKVRAEQLNAATQLLY
jgi:hypothetical protein